MRAWSQWWSKKQFAVAMVVFLGASSLNAASPSIGLQIGLSLANLNPPAGISAANIAGFAGGVTLEVPLSESICLQPEILFVQRGSVMVEGATVDISSRYNTIEIPVFLKLKLGTRLKPVVFAGPNFGFALSHSLSGPGGTGTITFDPRRPDFGFAFGGGVELDRFFVTLRYVLGLVDLDEGAASWQSRGFLALVGFKF